MGFELDLVLFLIGKMKLIFKSLRIFFQERGLSFETSVYFSCSSAMILNLVDYELNLHGGIMLRQIIKD